MLLESGLDANPSNSLGSRPLHLAADFNYIAATEALLEYGVCRDWDRARLYQRLA